MMKMTKTKIRPIRLLLLVAFLAVGLHAQADVDNQLIFRPITASGGIADNSAQTIECTYTGRIVITTIGTINFYDGANFSTINPDNEVKFKLDDYKGHYHLYFDNNHHLWLKSSHAVSCVNLTTEQYVQNIDSIFALYGSNGRVKDMFVDKNGDLWLCENGSLFSKKYGYKVALKKELNLQDIEVIDNQALILFYENGQLICHDVKTGRLLYENQAYAADDAEKYNRSGVMLIYGKGFYMIRNGEKGAILLRYETEDRQWKEVMHSDYHLNNLVMHDGKLFIASEWGYFTYSLSTGEIVHHKKLALNNGELLETDINTIEFDRQGGMWIGTEQRGLLYARPQNAPFMVYKWTNPEYMKYYDMLEGQKEITEFKGKKANVMVEDSRNWTWVGTSNGLFLYRTPQATPEVYSRKNGLLNSVIHSIVEDDYGNMWISTSYGISCLSVIDGQVKQIYSFNDEDNIPNETFINGRAIKRKDGLIVMQSLDHVVVFQPRDFLRQLNQPATEMSLKLTQMLVNGINVKAGDKVNGKVVLDKAITRTKEINLNYDQNTVSLTFSALNFARPLQSYYRVRIVEINKEWTEYSFFSGGGFVDRRGLLHLPLIGLKPGTYHIEVMASTVPGTFVGNPYEWIINVNQPWWRTTGIMLFIALLVLAVGIANFVVYNRNMKLKMRRNSEEGDVIRRIRAFVDRCDQYGSEQLAPTQEEIFGTEKETSRDLNEDFVELIQKLLPYVHERRGRLLTMHMLSQVAEMDVLGLYELIVGNIHKSPRPLVLSMRIEQAAKLLRTTDKSLDEITEECRFVSPNYLISQFFHKYRMTPSAYRKTAE